MKTKQITELRLRDGSTLQVSRTEGNKVRQRKAKGGVVFLSEHGNRMIDCYWIMDIVDKSVADLQAESRASRLIENRYRPVADNSPGYRRFLEARKSFKRRLGLR